MPYCQTEFNNISPENVEQVLSLFTKEHFVGGRATYQLDDGSYSIDAGENDIRAIFDEESASIKFFCRYEKEMEFYEKKLMSFAAGHNINICPD